MASVQDIRDLVSEYLSGEVTASDLANRFTPMLKAAIQSRDGAAKELGLTVHAQIAHYFNGFISEDEFHANLEPFSAVAVQGLASVSVQIVKVAEPQFVTSNPGSKQFSECDLVHSVTA